MTAKKKYFEKIIVKIFQILVCILFVILNYYSIGMTEENGSSLLNENVYSAPDSLVENAFWICIALFFFYVIQQIILRYAKKWNMQLIAAVISFIVALCCIYLVGASGTAPRADQEDVCFYADAFNRGDYSGLERGEYVGIYRQQLGIITLLRVLFYFFGDWNFHSFQYLSAVMAGALVFFGYKVVKYLSNHQKVAEAYYLLLSIACIPMYVYTLFVYGEIISTSLLLLAAWMLLSCLKNFSWGKVVVFGLSSGIAVQIRENSLIIIIGFFIVLIVKLIAENTKNAVILLIGIVLGVLLPSLVITQGIYGDKIPDDSDAMPAILHIAMGLNWDDENPGSYNAYNLRIFMENDYDVEASKEAAKQTIREFILTARYSDGYAVNFFVHKMTGQWSVPMYQCLVMNNYIVGEQSRLVHSIYYGRLRGLSQKFMNIYQLLIYGSVLFLLFAKRKEWMHLENYVLLIGIFGGFLFSMIWEAKARYVFPYFMFMIPYAAVGLGSISYKKMIKSKD